MFKKKQDEEDDDEAITPERSMYDVRQKLLRVKTDDEKEVEDIDAAEKILEKEG